MRRDFDIRRGTTASSIIEGRRQPARVWDSGLQGFLTAMEARDPGSEVHARRVASMSRITAESLGMDEPETLRVERAALIHDIGKIFVDSAILEAPRELT